MGTIILNWSSVIVLPLLLGGAVRFVCRKNSKAWLITSVAALLSVAAFVIAQNPPILGSELYGLRTVQAVCFTLGCLVVGLIVRKKA